MERLMPEPPECPVCLNPYEAVTIIPRVLPCGHSTCQPCLAQLPNPFLNTIRCPSCTHLVKLPNSLSSLPKNFDILRISALPQSHQPSFPKKVISPPTNDDVSFIPSLFPHEFYVNWIKWVLPKDILYVEPCPGKESNDQNIRRKTCCQGTASFRKRSLTSDNNVDETTNTNYEKCLFGSILGDGEKVWLVKVGSFVKEKFGDEILKYSYDVKVIRVLYGMGDRKRDEIELLLNAVLRHCRVGSVYGFWCDEEDDSVYMVIEGLSRSLKEIMEGSEYGFIGESEEKRLKKLVRFGMLGMEVCEAVSSLHSEGLVIGCLRFSCFGLDGFGRVYIDFHEAVEIGREIRWMLVDDFQTGGKIVDGNWNLFGNFISPEVLVHLLMEEGVELEGASSRFGVGCSSDVWSIACIVVGLLVGKPFLEEMSTYYKGLVFGGVADIKDQDRMGLYSSWMEKNIVLLERTLGLELLSLKEILCKCLEFNPKDRPALTELWKCMRELVFGSEFDVIAAVKTKVVRGSGNHCVILGDLCQVAMETIKRSIRHMADGLAENEENFKPDAHQEGISRVDRDVGDGIPGDHVNCIELKGHLDCITGLAVGGGYLFSSSYDKIVNIWSLEDLSHVYAFKGHEHKVTTVVYVDEGDPFCISGDNGGVICFWSTRAPLGPEPVKKLYEEKDWRYSGIHALALSGTEYLYTGSGDKTIKAWSLQDYTITCTMSGHKSVVSSLAVGNGVLYSGSWDGTVRLWCLSDHSPLTVLGEDRLGNVISVLSLAADSDVLVVAYEDGHIKIWHNETLVKSERKHNGAIFSVIKKGKWLFAGGWEKTITVQELSGNGAQLDVTTVGSIPSGSAITSLVYWQGKLFAGQADRVIKVYHSRF